MRSKVLAIIAGVLSLGLTGAASAADMPTKARVAAPVTGPNWSGFYIGGNIGVRWSRAKWDTLDFDTATAPAGDNPANLDRASARLGGYVGYNWMFAPAWLAGLEADMGWADGTATHSPFPGAAVFGFTAGSDFVNAKLRWDASVRGRLGYLVAPNWLVYGTGGIAWQRINTSASCTGDANSFCAGVFTDSFTETKTGWTAGAGIETMLWGHWIARGEYRYANFGHVSNRFPPAPIVGFHASVGIETHTGVLGIAYKF